MNDIFTGIITTKEFRNTKNTTFIGSRCFYAICFIGLFIIEMLIALFVRDAFIRPYMGDLVALKRCSTFNLLLYWDYKIVHWQK